MPSHCELFGVIAVGLESDFRINGKREILTPKFKGGGEVPAFSRDTVEILLQRVNRPSRAALPGYACGHDCGQHKSRDGNTS